GPTPPPPPAATMRGDNFLARSESRLHGTQSLVRTQGTGTRPGESEGGVAPFARTVPRPCPAGTTGGADAFARSESRLHGTQSLVHRARAPGRGSPRWA